MIRIRIENLFTVIAEAHALGQLRRDHLGLVIHMHHGAGP